MFQGFDGTVPDVGGYPFPPRLLELAVRRVKRGQEQRFDAERRRFIQFLGSFPGVGKSEEFQ